jgi:hypothetical protein
MSGDSDRRASVHTSPFTVLRSSLSGHHRPSGSSCVSGLPRVFLWLLLFSTQHPSRVLENPQPPNVTWLVHRTSSIVGRSSYIVHGSHSAFILPPSSFILAPCLRVSAFWFLNSPGSLCPLYGWGSSCPLSGPRSCGRPSPGNSSRSGHRNSQRTGPMLGPRTCLQYSYANSTWFRHCTCTLNRTRSSYRYGYRPCCRNGSCACARNSVCSRPRNSVRSGPRTSSRNSRRSCFCNGIQPCARPLFQSLLTMCAALS